MATPSGPTPLSQIALYHMVRRHPERGLVRRRVLEFFESPDGTFLTLPVARRGRIWVKGERVDVRVDTLGLLSLKAVADRPVPNGLHVMLEVESAIPRRWYSFHARVRGVSRVSGTMRLQIVSYVGRFNEPQGLPANTEHPTSKG